MAKLTAAQVTAIETVMYHMERSAAYLANDRVVVAIRKDVKTTSLDYVSDSGDVLYAVDKEIGSDIAGLQMAMGYLKNFLQFHAK